jgi:hypothetical protein
MDDAKIARELRYGVALINDWIEKAMAAGLHLEVGIGTAKRSMNMRGVLTPVPVVDVKIRREL